MPILFFIVLCNMALSYEVEEISVQDQLKSKMSDQRVKDSIIKTEVVTEESLDKKQAVNLSEAIQNSTGVESREGCSICGMRRVRINGMKGEHTTVLVDGVPLNSTVSSYYGFDALGTNGVERIEISRGGGAALIAPEAIGGVVNIVRKKATNDSSKINIGYGDFGYRLFQGTMTKVSKNKKMGTTFTAQHNEQDQRDFDNNGVNESPRSKSYVIGLKHSIDFNAKNNLTIDLTTMKSSVFGGPIVSSSFKPTSTTAGSVVFDGNDVRNNYTGSIDQITEIVDIQRQELTLQYTYQLSDLSNLNFKQSFAKQIQDSWYEGSDYYHENPTFFSDIQYNSQLNLEHFVTVGLDYKKEDLQSESVVFFDQGGRSKDNYDYESVGLYLRDIWEPNNKVELSTALRVNKITTDWTDKPLEDPEIDETILAPRVHLKWAHHKNWTSRVGAGVGYRSPLTFFESEHGILDDGFDVDISDLERSNSANYSLSYDSDRFLFNISASTTEVDNLAYVDDSPATPVLKNYNKALRVSHYDTTFGYQINTPWSVGLTLESFDYEDEYKQLMVVAAIEERVKLDFEYESDKFLFNTLFVWVGERDLADFGYTNRFNVYSGSGSAAKETKAESFVTIDLKATYTLNNDYKIYSGVRNLTDYTQEESPLFFDSHGDFDVTHIYGPLRGRQVYVGVMAEI